MTYLKQRLSCSKLHTSLHSSTITEKRLVVATCWKIDLFTSFAMMVMMEVNGLTQVICVDRVLAQDCLPLFFKFTV